MGVRWEVKAFFKNGASHAGYDSIDKAFESFKRIFMLSYNDAPDRIELLEIIDSVERCICLYDIRGIIQNEAIQTKYRGNRERDYDLGSLIPRRRFKSVEQRSKTN